VLGVLGVLGVGDGVIGGVRPGLGVGKAGSVGLAGTATGLPFVHVVQPATARAAVTAMAAAAVALSTTTSLRM
jgi:hypothetical protein